VQVLCTPPIFAPRSQAGTGVIIKMQGRKKHHYLEKEVSDLKNSMSMIKKKKEI
jgi:hypothetical protein